MTEISNRKRKAIRYNMKKRRTYLNSVIAHPEIEFGVPITSDAFPDTGLWRIIDEYMRLTSIAFGVDRERFIE